MIYLLELNKEITDLKYKLDAAEGDTDKQDILNTFKNKIDLLKQELSQLNINLGGLKRDREEATKKRTKCQDEIIVLRDKYERSLPTQKTLDKTNIYIGFFDNFIKSLLKSKIDLLKQSFNECLSKLIEKEMIEKVDIDNKFNITISDKIGKKGRKSISEGQKQLVTTALMQALNAITNVQSFVCIDTPLGRMDRDYKQKIIKYYYPNASKQVIILATSSEITKGSNEYKLLNQIVAKEYTIEYDKEQSSAVFK